MKKLIFILVMLAVAGYVFRGPLTFMLMRINLKPDQTFAETTAPTAPDYANPAHWAALPDKQDNADLTPPGIERIDENAGVDVFFIHPTTYYTSDSWNQPLDHAEANEFTDEQVLPNQAAVFNSCCRVFAPRYRQATLFSFMDDSGDGEAALELAYQDVSEAFDYFLTHYSHDRPFVLAGHSQGAKHADRLLAEVISGTELEARLVAAYPVGFSIDGSNGIAVCETPTQTGCQVTWNTLGAEAETFGDPSSDICVNPLHWRNDGSRADFASNLGGVTFRDEFSVEPGVTDAQCIDGVLRVSEVRSDNYSAMMFGDGNYHVYDFSLFHMNIRQNAEARVAAYLSEG